MELYNYGKTIYVIFHYLTDLGFEYVHHLFWALYVHEYALYRNNCMKICDCN